MIISRTRYLIGFLNLALIIFSSCSRIGELRIGVHKSPHERYMKGLEEAGLTHTALGKKWIEASEKVFEDSTLVQLPYKEFGYFPAHDPMAARFAISLKKGQRFLAKLMTTSADTAKVFMDLFAKDQGGLEVVQYAKDSTALDYEVKEDGVYLLRIQPELLQSLNYNLMLETEPILAFPVAGKDRRAIGSVWGDPRGGGKRKHKGVDIFAKKGTPVVAAADGVISRVGNNKLGGKVIMLRDQRRNYSFYYAHLNEQLVREGQIVARLETLGTVGTTGNAKHTPPHLHFGIYSYGAIDPLPFIHKDFKKDFRIRNPDFAGDTMRLVRKQVKSKRGEKESSSQQPPVVVLAVSENGIRVKLPDNNTAIVPVTSVEQMKPFSSKTLKAKIALYSLPNNSAPIKDSIQNLTVKVLGAFDGYTYVIANGIGDGWIRTSQ